jgi:hypothetical protein
LNSTLALISTVIAAGRLGDPHLTVLNQRLHGLQHILGDLLHAFRGFDSLRRVRCLPLLRHGFADRLAGAAQDLGISGLHLDQFVGALRILESVDQRVRHDPVFAFVDRGDGVHNDEKGEQQGDEVGVGNQPAFDIFVFFGLFLAGHVRNSRFGIAQDR